MDAGELGALLPGQLPGLLRLARSLARDPASAEDLVQDTVTRALERAEGLRDPAALGAWLHRILHNLAVDAARRSREMPTEDAERLAEAIEARWRQDSYTVDAAAVVARAETRAHLQDALVHLPVDYRAVVVLHDAEGLTVREIAEIQGVSLSAAKQRLRRGRMMLVSELARDAQRREEARGVPMRCWDARRRISDYLDGELAEAEAARVERHLAGCPTCPPLYAALVGATGALHSSAAQRDPDTVVPEALAVRLRGLLEPESAPAGQDLLAAEDRPGGEEHPHHGQHEHAAHHQGGAGG